MWRRISPHPAPIFNGSGDRMTPDAIEKKLRKHPYGSLTICAAISAAMLTAGIMWIDNLSISLVLERLLLPLLRLILFICIGLVVGQIIETLGWTRSLSVVARPLFRFGNLDDRSSAAFTTAFFSGVAANAMLLDFYKDGKISKQALFLTNFINQFPAFFLHLPTTFFIVVPLTGRAGIIYFLITFLATVLRTLGFVLYGRLRLSASPGHITGETDKKDPPGKPRRSIWQEIRSKFPPRIARIVVYVVPIYILVFIVNAKGFFTAAQNWMAGAIAVKFLPVEALSFVVLSFVAEFTSGFAAAGALLQAGAITVKQTVFALLVGNIVAFPIRALRHQLPRYMGIFSPRMGAQILFMGQGFRVLSLVAAGSIYYYIF
jgi:hypothetical protein